MERREKVANFIKELTASYLARAQNGTALITVTAANCSADLKRATIFITVLPESKETETLAFVKKERSEIHELLKQKMATKNVPFVDFQIDQGEKNRQKIDELLQGK